jgi:16S rRNA C967 or C1407 C5-methylase (RsmB/RsmF family)/NOL1/NOP2/fmu family ribosome biogenesis protein
MLPLAFEEQTRRQLGEAWPDFVRAIQEEPPVSIRLNASKMPDNMALMPDFDGEVAWLGEFGRYLKKRPVFTLDPLHHAGAYYVQEASSMFLGEALRQCADLNKPLKILDLCAAPGGKSTLLASMLSQGGLLVANEAIRTRVAPLRENLERWGAAAVAVTHADAEQFEALEGWFDVVVADVPCSGEGMFRKDPDARSEWSPEHVSFCAARSRKILASAVAALAPGGCLLLSTCTFNPIENEENVEWLTRQFPLELIRLSADENQGIEPSDKGLRFWPHRVRGEGFFIAALRKSDGRVWEKRATNSFKKLSVLSRRQSEGLDRWLDSAFDPLYVQSPTGDILALRSDLVGHYAALDAALDGGKWFGTVMGQLKGADLVPDHALAMSVEQSKNIARIELNLEDALVFLKKEVFDVPAGTSTGWATPTYGGLPLGWVKILPNRLNNYLPQERRIRMDTRPVSAP